MPNVYISGLQLFKYRPLPHPTSQTNDDGSKAAKNWATFGRIDPVGSTQFS